MFIFLRPTPELLDPAALQQAHARVKHELRLLARGPAEPAFGLRDISFCYGAKAMRDVKRGPYEKTAAQVDWAAWRSAFEYYGLFVRSDRSKIGATNTIDASQALSGALSLWLMQRGDEARAYLRRWGPGLEKTIDYMNIAKKTPRIGTGDLAVFGFLYQSLLGWVPPHPALAFDETIVTSAVRARVPQVRAEYARTNAATGCLLGGFAYDRIPLELIFLNAHAQAVDQDQGLFAIAKAIAATEDPSDPNLAAYDKMLTDTGF